MQRTKAGRSFLLKAASSGVKLPHEPLRCMALQEEAQPPVYLTA